VGGTARNRIARINSNGTLDAAFNPNANDHVRAIIETKNFNRYVIVGDFSQISNKCNRGQRKF
jgi:hypothetical protein